MLKNKFRGTKFVLGVFLLLSFLVVASVSADSEDAPITYRVTVENLTHGQPFTPPVIATHNRNIELFQRNQPANIGIQQIAENGNLAPMLDILSNSADVSDFTVAVAGDPPPLMPQSEVTVEITANSVNDVLSVAAMLICTNDSFAGLDSVTLPKQVGQTKTFKIRGYDAGTEINTEDFADIVPPCQGLTGVSSEDPGTGMSNPALAENGVIRVDKRNGGNVLGISDLLPSIHDWAGIVGTLTIERVQ